MSSFTVFINLNKFSHFTETSIQLSTVKKRQNPGNNLSHYEVMKQTAFFFKKKLSNTCFFSF